MGTGVASSNWLIHALSEPACPDFLSEENEKPNSESGTGNASSASSNSKSASVLPRMSRCELRTRPRRSLIGSVDPLSASGSMVGTSNDRRPAVSASQRANSVLPVPGGP